MGGSSKSVTVGYKYYVGMHMVLCRGPVDYLKEALVDDKTALLGNFVSGTYSISKNNLFGGESREGGVSGLLDVMGGESTQTVNSYLSSKLGSLVPSFRGVLSVVFRQMYLGINPYLKKWSFLAQRVHVRQNGLAQWYDAKSAILSNSYVIPPGNQWRYKVLNVDDASDYHLESFDDSTWDIGYSPFSSECLDYPTTFGFAGCPATTVPQQKLVWMRTYFTLSQIPTEDLEFQAFIDNGVEIWINDTKVVDYYNAHGTYYTTTIPVSVLRQGSNFIAAKGRDDGLGVRPGNYFYFDFRIRAQAFEMWDMNPAHIIRECLTDPDWGMGYAEADMDDTSFTYAADTLYEENMGMSLLWDTQISIEEFVQLVCKHINASIYVDRKTGLFVLKLIRQDYDEEDLLVLNPSNVSQVQDFSRVQFGELVNSITVSYWNSSIRDTSTLTVTDIALASTQGATINTSVKYDGFTTADIASRVAQRDLKALSTPIISCTVYANTDAEDLNIGDCFKLSWPDYDIDEVIMRVATIGYGDGKSNRVRLTCTQDVFAMPGTAYIAPTPPEGVPTNDPPVPVAERLAFELPYLEAVQQLGQSVVDSNLATQPYISYFAIAAGRPSSNSLNARLYTDAGAGYQEQSTLDFCPFAKLSADIDEIEDSFAIEDVQDASEIQLGSWFQIGTEIMEVVTIISGTITVKRGLLDTVPTKHTAGDTLFFWDLYATEDSTQYVIGEVISGKLATVTGSGVLPLSSAPADSVTMAGRLIRPYPPANVQLDGQYWPDQLQGVVPIVWAERNRLQQTGADYVGWYEGTITPEVGQTYGYEEYDAISDTLLASGTGIIGTSTSLSFHTQNVRLEMFSERDGYESYQRFVHSFEYLSIVDALFEGGFVNKGYFAEMNAIGATAPVVWSLSGSVPPGLVIAKGTGATNYLTGLPTTAGSYTFTVSAVDANSVAYTKTVTIDVGTTSYLMHFTGAQGGTVFTEEMGRTFTRSGSNAITQTAVAGPNSNFGSTFQTSGGSYLQRANETQNNLSSVDFTIDFWARKTGADAYSTLFGKRTSGGQYDWLFRWYAADDKPFFIHCNSSGGNVRTNIAPSAVSRNTWHHFSISRKGSGASTVVRFWIDGVMVSETTRPDNISGNNLALFFGDSSGGYGDDNFAGQMDEFFLATGAALHWDEATFDVPTFPHIQNPAERTVNGTFAAGTNWTQASGTAWSIASGVASNNGSTFEAFVNDAMGTLAPASIYLVSLTVSTYTSGAFTVQLYDSATSTVVAETNEFTATGIAAIVANASFNTIRIFPNQTNGFVGGIDTISVKQCAWI